MCTGGQKIRLNRPIVCADGLLMRILVLNIETGGLPEWNLA